MLPNPPPDRCDGCGRVARAPQATGLATGDLRAWIALDGAGGEVVLDDGRSVRRLGRGWACRRCGHTVPLSFEHAR
jgi:hypothetical protein